MDNFEIYSFLKSKGGSGNALVNTSSYDSPVFKVGDTITIVGSATGGTAPYTYDFYIKRGTATNWSSREPDQGDNVINLRPTSATSYQVKIDVTDSEGATASKILSFSVVSASSTLNMTSSPNVFSPTASLAVESGDLEGI